MSLPPIVLQRLYGSIAAGERPGSSWDDFNEILTDTLPWLRIAGAPGAERSLEGGGVGLAWQGRAPGFDPLADRVARVRSADV